MSKWFNEVAQDFSQTLLEGGRWKSLISALGITLEVTILALLIGIVLGVLVASVRTSHDKLKEQHKLGTGLKIANTICELYLTIIRGTPMMVQLLIMYFAILVSTTNTTLVAVLSFGINSGAYLAEIIRSGIGSIDIGQDEAGRSLGLSYFQTMRFIIIPQAIKNILPALGNEFIALLKETSIVNVIGMKDITKWAINVQGRTYQAFMPFLIVAGIYLILVIGLSKAFDALEKHMRHGKKQRRKKQ